MRMTLPTALVLHAVDAGFRYGFEIIDATGFAAGTVYPVLRRLEEAGCVSGAWEPVARSRAEGVTIVPFTTRNSPELGMSRSVMTARMDKRLA